MTKLSQFYKEIGKYIELHGDKDVTSITSSYGYDDHEYTLNVHDIHNENNEWNKYTGGDKIYIPNSNYNLNSKVKSC